MPTVVIGLGNPLMGDDGLGLAALARLRERWRVTPAVAWVDGGTWGLQLLPEVEGARRLLLIDAIDAGAAPGSLIQLAGAQLPQYLAQRVSVHHVDLADVLALAAWRSRLPKQAEAVGLQPGRVELSDRLSDVVALHLPTLIAAALRVLMRWGHRCHHVARARHLPLPPTSYGVRRRATQKVAPFGP